MNLTSLPSIGEFEIIEVYEFYDRPLLFSIKNMMGTYYVIAFAGSDQYSDIWMGTPISEQRLFEFESGLVSIRNIFEIPETSYVFFLKITNDGVADIDYVNALSQSQILLPYLAEPEEYINTRSTSIAQANASAILKLSDQRRTFVNLKLDKLSGTKSSINLKKIGNVFSNLQDTLSNIGMNVSGIDNERGRVPNAVFEETALDFAVGWNGSIGITMFSEETDRLLGANTLDKSLNILFDLFSSSSTLGYFFNYTNENLQGLSKRTLLKFKSLLASIGAADVDLYMSTGSVSSGLREISVSRSEILGKVKQIESYADFSERVYRLRGTVLAVNTSTGRMEILESENNVKYIAYVYDENHFLNNRIDIPSEYILTISESISVNSNTGEEVSSLRVISYISARELDN